VDAIEDGADVAVTEPCPDDALVDEASLQPHLVRAFIDDLEPELHRCASVSTLID
jgi:hypothetical protein